MRKRKVLRTNDGTLRNLTANRYRFFRWIVTSLNCHRQTDQVLFISQTGESLWRLELIYISTYELLLSLRL